MSKTKSGNKNTSGLSNEPIEVVVTLTAEDYEKASVAAKLGNETVARWIASLVNTALQP